mmetsp:Transcript_31487/g.63353  ORF Transcript_31487/g.63353 Transcript_31487/m.63353 type:complete len:82 (+) Transcript_31487:248-493(+)
MSGLMGWVFTEVFFAEGRSPNRSMFSVLEKLLGGCCCCRRREYHQFTDTAATAVQATQARRNTETAMGMALRTRILPRGGG